MMGHSNDRNDATRRPHCSIEDLCLKSKDKVWMAPIDKPTVESVITLCHKPPAKRNVGDLCTA